MLDYIATLNKVTSFLRPMLRVMGPNRNLDFGLFFFFIMIPELSLNRTVLASLLCLLWFTLIIQLLHILPRRLYLYLKPLYSMRGGSTTLAEPFIKKPIVVTLLWKPLYKWKIRSHLTLVLSLTNNQVAFCNTYTFS